MKHASIWTPKIQTDITRRLKGQKRRIFTIQLPLRDRKSGITIRDNLKAPIKPMTSPYYFKQYMY